MGSESSKESAGEDVARISTEKTAVATTSSSLPLEETRQSPILTQHEYFHNLRKELSRIAAALDNGSQAPLPIAYVVELFTPPQENYEGQKFNLVKESLKDFHALYPSTTSLLVDAMEIGQIMTYTTNPVATSSNSTTAESPVGPFLLFNVKIHFEAMRISYGFKEIPNTNSFYHSPKTLSFGMSFDNSLSNYLFYRIRKTNNTILRDFIVTRQIEGKTVDMSVVPIEEGVLSTQLNYVETIPVASFFEYMLSRFTALDPSRLSRYDMFASSQEEVTVSLEFSKVSYVKEQRRWVLGNNRIQVQGKHTYLTINGDKYFIVLVNPIHYSCTFYAYCTHPEVQNATVNLATPGSSDCSITIERPQSKNQYTSSGSLFSTRPLTTLGSLALTNKSRKTTLFPENFKVPPFLRDHCNICLTTTRTLIAGEIQAERAQLVAKVKPKHKFLEMGHFSVTPSGIPCHLSVNLMVSPNKCTIFQGNVSADTLCQSIEAQQFKTYMKLNLGQFIFDSCNFLTWKRKNHGVPAEKLKELRRYQIIATKGKLNFATQQFETQLSIVKQEVETAHLMQHRYAVPYKRSAATCLFTLNFENMTATFVEKKLLDIELEFGIGPHVANLPENMWKAATKCSFTDVTCFFQREE